MTAPHSSERKDLLAKASTVGSCFHATGGEFLNSDELFIAEERKKRNGELKILKTKKEQQKNQKIRESEGKAYIQKLLAGKTNMRILKRV